MPTPLYNTDVQKIVDRTPKTALLDTDVFVVADKDGTLAPITKPNAKETLGINDAEDRLDTAEGEIDDLQTAENAIKGTSWTDENLVDHETRIDTLETNDTLQDATLGTLKETVLATKLAVNELERQSQIGNGATLDFSDIGSVALDARATGRANPTVEGLTATNSFQSSSFATTTESGITYTKVNNLTWNINGTASGENTKSIYLNENLIDGHVYYFNRYTNCDGQLSIQATGMFSQTLDLDIVFTAVIGSGYNIRFVHSASAVINNVTIKPLLIDLTQIYGAGNEPTASDCAKIFSYFDGTKSIQMPARVRSVGKNLFDKDAYKNLRTKYDFIDPATYHAKIIKLSPNTQYTVKGYGSNQSTPIILLNVYSKVNRAGYFDFRDGNKKTFTTLSDGYLYIGVLDATDDQVNARLDNLNVQIELGSTATTYESYKDSTLYIADDKEGRSIQDIMDTVSVVNGEYIYTQKVSTPVAVLSGVAVNTTNYPTTKNGGKFAVELTAGGTQIGVIGTDSTTGDGTLRYELATPITTNLTTSGALKAFQNGSVHWEPYYEGSHQTDASSQITLPYEGMIDAVYGYDEDLVEYELLSSEYSLTGDVLTITDALENEVFYVQMSRSEPLAPKMSVNVLNNEQVTLDSLNDKYYRITFTTANGVPTTVATEIT